MTQSIDYKEEFFELYKWLHEEHNKYEEWGEEAVEEGHRMEEIKNLGKASAIFRVISRMKNRVPSLSQEFCGEPIQESMKSEETKTKSTGFPVLDEYLPKDGIKSDEIFSYVTSHSMPKEMIEMLADTDMIDVDEDNGPGYVYCPICKARINMKWDWGRRLDRIDDIKHEANCPVEYAKEMLCKNTK